jgi:hypothetical protein
MLRGVSGNWLELTEKPGNKGEQTATRRDTKSSALTSEVNVFL